MDELYDVQVTKSALHPNRWYIWLAHLPQAIVMIEVKKDGSYEVQQREQD